MTDRTMTEKARKLAALRSLTTAAREARLAELRRAAAARDATLAMLARIDRRSMVDPGDIAAHCAQALYAQWQQNQRRHLNLRLARETAIWLAAKEEAARAFGRDEVLGKLIERAGARKG
ncbi:hypothetical protein [Halodurantibacterium flavum]|uniref:Uncharacterized protein n=1 Tax=Halodurantibacterium flavum TaxID=1382802 RepID=A0ABW4S7Q1_9RHOB